MIYDPRHTASLFERAVQYANAHSIEIIAKKADTTRAVLPLLEELKGKIDVFIMLPDVTVTNRETIDSMLLFSFRNRIPIFTFSEKYVEMGALAALIVNPYDLGAQTGEIVRKRLEGRFTGWFDTRIRAATGLADQPEDSSKAGNCHP